MGIDSASVGRKVRETCAEQKMVEELRKRLGESLKVKTGNCEEIRLTYFPARGRAEISRLILKHAGVKFDDIRLTGEDFAKAKANEIVLAMNGLFETIAKILFSPEGEKAGMKKKLLEETLPQKFGQLEGRLCLNGGQFFSGNALTYADIMLVVLQDNLRSAVIGGGDVIEKFPKMCNLFQRVSCLPNIKAWRGSRPIDPMFNN